MSRTIVLGSNQLNPNLAIPADTESIDSASVELYSRPLGEGILYEHNRLNNIESRFPSVPGNTYAAIVPLDPAVRTTGWLWTYSAVRPFLVTTSTGASVLTWDVSPYLPVQGKITGVDVQILGGPGHAGLPGTMPSIVLSENPNGTGGSTVDTAQTVLTNTPDPSPNVAAYQQVHTISSFFSGHTITSSSFYTLQFIPENGTNALINLIVSRIILYVTG